MEDAKRVGEQTDHHDDKRGEEANFSNLIALGEGDGPETVRPDSPPPKGHNVEPLVAEGLALLHEARQEILQSLKEHTLSKERAIQKAVQCLHRWKKAKKAGVADEELWRVIVAELEAVDATVPANQAKDWESHAAVRLCWPEQIDEELRMNGEQIRKRMTKVVYCFAHNVKHVQPDGIAAHIRATGGYTKWAGMSWKDLKNGLSSPPEAVEVNDSPKLKKAEGPEQGNKDEAPAYNTGDGGDTDDADNQPPEGKRRQIEEADGTDDGGSGETPAEFLERELSDLDNDSEDCGEINDESDTDANDNAETGNGDAGSIDKGPSAIGQQYLDEVNFLPDGASSVEPPPLTPSKDWCVPAGWTAQAGTYGDKGIVLFWRQIDPTT